MKKRLALPKVYDSLDAPVYVWNKVHESQDTSHLLIKKVKITKRIAKYLNDVWMNIYDEFIKEFGLSDQFISIKQKEIEIAQLRCQQMMTGDNSIESFIDIAEIELDEMRKASNGISSFMKTAIVIEKQMGFQINLMDTSIRKFYSYLKELKQNV